MLAIVAFYKAYKDMILVGLAVAFLAGVYIKGHSDGVDSERLVNLTAENAALIETSKAIAEAFGKYEPILADLNATPDPSKSPALITSTIGRMPEPKSKKK